MLKSRKFHDGSCDDHNYFVVAYYVIISDYLYQASDTEVENTRRKPRRHQSSFADLEKRARDLEIVFVARKDCCCRTCPMTLRSNNSDIVIVHKLSQIWLHTRSNNLPDNAYQCASRWITKTYQERSFNLSLTWWLGLDPCAMNDIPAIFDLPLRPSWWHKISTQCCKWCRRCGFSGQDVEPMRGEAWYHPWNIRKPPKRNIAMEKCQLKDSFLFRLWIGVTNLLDFAKIAQLWFVEDIVLTAGPFGRFQLLVVFWLQVEDTMLKTTGHLQDCKAARPGGFWFCQTNVCFLFKDWFP